jgi:multiple sugar transport system permease protein/raffinose/stachyose/melibiose transport system permease protein
MASPTPRTAGAPLQPSPGSTLAGGSSLTAPAGLLPAPGPEPRGARTAHFRKVLDVAAAQSLLTPVVFIFVALFLVPIGASIFLSFTDFNGYTTHFSFVGLANYRALLSSDQILSGLYFSILYAVATTVLVTLIAVPLAVVLNRRFFGRNFVRAALFFPAVPSLLVLGLVWAYIFAPISSGVVNSVLHDLFGLGPVLWLSEDRLAQLSVIIVGVWAQAGWHATLYLAYLQSIPGDYYDAAMIDGASNYQCFFRITFPLLAPAMTVSVVLLMTGGLRVYELPLAITSGNGSPGGPGYSTYTVTQNILQFGVSQGQYGQGSAMSVLFLLLVVAALLVVLSLLRRREARLR